MYKKTDKTSKKYGYNSKIRLDKFLQKITFCYLTIALYAHLILL